MIAVLASFLALLAAQLAVPVASAADILTFEPVADTTADSAAPTTSFGAALDLRADASPLGLIYLRFAVSGVGGRPVESVRLRLTVSNQSDSGGTVHRVTPTGWTESSLTFATRPPVDGPGLATLGTVELGATVEFGLDGAIAGDGTWELAIDSTSNNGVSYLSRSAPAGQRPTLVLTLAGDPVPEVTIQQPADGTVFHAGHTVVLHARASDPVDGDLGGAVVWHSDLQGALGTGALVHAPLDLGAHLLTATVSNAAGWSATATVHVVVDPPPAGGTPPVVTILSPHDGITVPAERIVTFTASAMDLEDGPLDNHITWTSDVDGTLGEGATIATALDPGTHRVTAAVTDSGGLMRSAEITVRVLPPVTLTFAPVADTYVESNNAGKNFGTGTTLRAGDAPIRLTYLRFAVAGLGTRPVRSATLRLRVASGSSSGSDSGGIVRTLTHTTWVEKSVTYSNKPMVDGPALATLGAVTPKQTVEVPITGTVFADGAYSLAIVSTSRQPVTYTSRETATPPALVVTLGNAAPAVTVTAPPAGTAVFQGTPITLAATALDPEDGDLGAELTWTSDLDGPLGTGPQVVMTPRTIGVHTITAQVADLDARTGEASVALRVRGPNHPPTVAITHPLPATAIGAGTPLTLTAVMADDFDAAPAVRWSSSRDGILGSGASLVTALSEGPHTLRATATDSDGATGGATVDVTVTPAPPVVTITAPADGTTLVNSTVVTLRATASDPSDGDLSSQIEWRSDVDGLIGTGGTLMTAGLSIGPHRLIATVADSSGLRGTDEHLVQVVPPPAGTAGFRDHRFGSGVEYGVQKATAEKPESKLWHQGGIWWGVLYRPGAGFRIHRLDFATQRWLDTGVLVDERPHSRQDALWDGQALYILSRHEASGKTTRLLRFHYEAGLGMYLRDAGFPVLLPGGGAESMTLAKDSTGSLWVAYTLGSKVWVNESLGSDTEWGSPVALPVGDAAKVDSDDIATVVALPNAIGVFWANQRTDAVHFAVHADGGALAAASAWRLETPGKGGRIADDHFNVKTTSDGRVFALIKTSVSNPSKTLAGLLVRSASGSWSPLHQVTTFAFWPTRPQCVIDEVSRKIYAFYSVEKTAVYMKVSDLDTIAFPSGIGTPFIASPLSNNINNPTTCKHPVSPETRLVVLASDHLDYWHNVH